MIATVPIDLRRGRLGLPSMLLREVAGEPVLARTLGRLRQVASLAAIVLVHPAGQDVGAILGLQSRHAMQGPAIEMFAFDEAALADAQQGSRIAARKWSPHSWRGGLGSATCYDELLPAAPIAAAMAAHEADGALLVGGDWPLLDPRLCEAVIARHLEAPQSMKMVFTQAPPGLAGVALSREFAEDLAAKGAGFGQMAGYIPSRPQPDPIGLDVCVQVPAHVRSCAKRFICDTPRSAAMIDAIAKRAGAESSQIDAAEACTIAAGIDQSRAFLPQQVTLELTPQRLVTGPLTPQRHIAFDRPPMPLDAAMRIVEQLGEAGDIALTLGGLGDALLHPHWRAIVDAARRAGVLAIALETDLIIAQDQLDQLLEAPIDVLSVRLNADTAALYERVMGADHFAQVTLNLQWLLSQRQRRPRDGRAGLPWIVPRMVKTAETLVDMETFFDRWMHFSGHAVIEPATTGRRGSTALAPARSPVNMAPPRRIACRQIERRMTILADGVVSLCDQDWLGSEPIGDVTITPLIDIWQAGQQRREAHLAGQWNDLAMCAGCSEWHRP